MLEPPVSTPISRITAILASRMRWYSLSERVWAGATVIESPVWTPIGSKFSIEQMMTTLSSVSRITSISYSFQPMMDSSIKTSSVGDWSIPRRTRRSNSSLLYAMADPLPPIVKLGRIKQGSPTFSITVRACSTVVTVSPIQISRPMLFIACWKRSRFSALSMTSASAPIISTPYFSRIPCSERSIARLSAVCPPRVGSNASGFSFAMIFSTMRHSNGSM